MSLMGWWRPRKRRGVGAAPLAYQDVLDLVASLGGDSIVRQFHDARFGVRTVGSVVQVWDDARCATAGGRYHFPGIAANTDWINCGNCVNFDALAALSFTVWFELQSITVTASGLLSRFFNAGAAVDRQLMLRVTTGGKLECLIHDGVGDSINTGSTTLVAGVIYKATVVYDGSLAAANRVKIYLGTFNRITQVWGADAAEGITNTGQAVPAAMTTAAAAVPLLIGEGQQTTLGTAGNNPTHGFIDEARVWFGTALTSGQAQAETLAANPVAANLRYTFAANANNSGSTAGFNGTPTTNAVLCSDDTRYGRALTCTKNALTSRPAWDAGNTEIDLDASNDTLGTIVEDTFFQLNSAVSAYAVGKINSGTGALLGVSNAGLGRLLSIRGGFTATGFICGRSTAGGVDTEVSTTVALAATKRLMDVKRTAAAAGVTKSRCLDVAEQSAGSTTMAAGAVSLNVGCLTPGVNFCNGSISAVIFLLAENTAHDALVKTWATARHNPSYA